MLGEQGRRWYVSLEQTPGITVARFGTMQRETGHQIWDEVIWPLPITEFTERFILGELYAITVDFWSTRE